MDLHGKQVRQVGAALLLLMVGEGRGGGAGGVLGREHLDCGREASPSSSCRLLGGGMTCGLAAAAVIGGANGSGGGRGLHGGYLLTCMW